MKVLVTTKLAIDYQVKVVVSADERGVETEGVQMSMNPFDAIAVEACVQMQESNLVSSSTVITIDEDDSVLRQALAMGIQNAVQIPQQVTDPFPKAKLLAEYIQSQDFDLILMGKLSIDGDHSQLPSLLAGMLDWPAITNASEISHAQDLLEIKREADEGIVTMSTPTPCVVSCDLRLNTPRFVALPKLLQAKKETIEVYDVAADPNPHEILRVSRPAQKTGNPPTDNLDTFIQSLVDGGIIS